MALVDLLGRRFGHLLVEDVGPVLLRTRKRGGGTEQERVYQWWCRCDCGRLELVAGQNLARSRRPRRYCVPCGRKATGRAATKHGLPHTPEYRCWVGVKSRCYSPKSALYSRYGARGIHMCLRWREDAAAFVADMGPKPTPKHSIDRINNAGSYTCGKCEECTFRGVALNCRWATTAEQNANRSNTILLSHNGRTQTIAAWANELGLILRYSEGTRTAGMVR